MTENNEIKEMKYTEEQVMNALLQLEPEERELLLNGKFSDIMKLVNDDEIAKNVLYEWLTFARTYSNAVNGVLQLRKALRRQDNETINIVECIAKYYKGLSREERLEFSKRIAEASDLDNSLDSLKYQWSK